MVETEVEDVKSVSVVNMYPWQAFTYPPGNMSPVFHQLPVMPSSLAKHPQLWSKEEVSVWLKWCEEEYSISHISPDKFNMNGKALCLLIRSDFMERVPHVGDILYNVLQKLINRGSGPMIFQPLPTYPAITSGNSNFSSSPPSSIPAVRRENSYHLVPGTSSRPALPNSRPNYIPILPDLKKAIQPRETPKYTIPITPYRSLLSKPPDAVLSPAPSGGSDSGHSDHPSDNASPTQHLDSTSDVYTDCHMTKYSNGIKSVEDNRSQPDHINLTWSEKNSEYIDGDGRDEMMLGEYKLSADTKFHFTQSNGRTGDCRLLWEFINYLLENGSYSDYIRWEDQDKLTFRIINPTALAELWGIQKNRTNMTYEKLSRALRYYYKMNIIRKVPGKRLTYQFLRQPKDIKKGQRGARPQSRNVPNNFTYPNDIAALPNVESGHEKNKYNYGEDSSFGSPTNPSIGLPDRINIHRRNTKDDQDGYSSSPPTPGFSPRSDSVVYKGRADMDSFPIQDEPEDLSVKMTVSENVYIKEETLLEKHDISKVLNDLSERFPSVTRVKDEPQSSEMEANS